MKRVLFVDDEPLVLDAMRALFRRQRLEWDMVFAAGGPQAIAELDGPMFDVVVSDMRMPIADGNAVLSAVRERHPAAARVILSGHAGREAELAALTVAHQFVSKPCEPARLRGIIERACALPTLIESDRLRSLVGRLNRLPSPPQLYFDLTRATARPQVTMGELAALVEQDPAMATKVLQLVNSAMFGSTRVHSSVREALVYVGTERLKALALTAQVFLEGDSGAGVDLEVQQQHAVSVALLAQQCIADPARAETAYTAGLLHDVGTIVLGMCAPEAMQEARRICDATGRPAHEVEQELLGTDHADAGAYLLALWGLPLEIIETAQHHHRPDRAPTDIAVAVHVADALLHDADPRTGGHAPSRLDLAFLEHSPFADRLPRWRALASDVRVQ